MILLDTNLLARVTNTADPHCSVARDAIHKLTARNQRLVLFPQNLYEFWAMATRSAGPSPGGSNGLGMTIDQASQWVAFFRRRFALLPDREDLVGRWHDLVRAFGIRGYRAHDARLVAGMQTYGIASVLTFNASDFAGFGVMVLSPASI